MKSDGFIATSIIYSFFLVFITLFVALIANNIQNRSLVSKLDEAAWNNLKKINNTKLTDLRIGDKIRFTNNPSSDVFNEDAIWVVSYIEENDDLKTIYFLSDLTAHNDSIKIQLATEAFPKYHPLTLEIYKVAKDSNIYNNAIMFNNYVNAGVANNHYIYFSIPSSSDLKKIRSSSYSDILNNAIYRVDSSYLIYIDEDEPNYTKDAYYEYRLYNFSNEIDFDSSLINSYCFGNIDTDNIEYEPNNTFGYINTSNLIDGSKYINYCFYASPIAYTHKKDDMIVYLDENKESDIFASDYASINSLRLIGKTTLSKNDTDIYISGGKGTSNDPYILTNGVKKR